ncbi:MAG: CcmD family protein [Acidimicrobiales bacterium]
MGWNYVIVGYLIVGVGTAAYAAALVRQGKRLAEQIPPERRRFLD